MSIERISMIAAVEGLATKVATQPRSTVRSLEIGLICATAGVIGRAAFDPVLGEHLPFSMFFPALLAAALFGGPPAAGLALGVTTLSGWFLFMSPRLSFAIAEGKELQIPIFVAIGLLTIGISLILRSALMRLETHRRRYEGLVSELSERLQNDLARVAAIAQESLRDVAGRPRAGEALVDRLAVLQEAHQDLSRLDWRPISLRRVVGQPLRYLAPAEAGRIALEGPDLELDPDLAVSLALCIWELADSARARGILVDPDGRVQVTWVVVGSLVLLNWIETGAGGETQVRNLQRRLASERLSWRLEPAIDVVHWSVRFESRARQAVAPRGAAQAA